MFRRRDGRWQRRRSPLRPCILEGGCGYPGTRAGDRAFTPGTVGRHRQDVDGRAQRFRRAEQVRRALCVPPRGRHAGHPLEGGGDAFLLPCCLPERKALPVLRQSVRMPPLLQGDRAENGKGMRAPPSISQLPPYRQAFLTQHSRPLHVAPLQHGNGQCGERTGNSEGGAMCTRERQALLAQRARSLVLVQSEQDQARICKGDGRLRQ